MNTVDLATKRTSPEIDKLNAVLGRELGYAPDNEPIYRFEWTEDLFWPLYKTGRMIAETTTHEVPILGTEETEVVGEKKIVPEYCRSRMTHKYRDQWVVTAWLPPEGLAQWVCDAGNVTTPRDWEALAQWANNYQGVEYPSRGYRVCTNYRVPRGLTPNMDDVQRFCAGVRFNRSMNDLGVAQMFAAQDAKAHPAPPTHPDEINLNSETGAEIVETFPAFMNPTPGKRGGSVSVGGVGENPVSRKKNSEPIITLAIN